MLLEVEIRQTSDRFGNFKVRRILKWSNTDICAFSLGLSTNCDVRWILIELLQTRHMTSLTS